MNYVGERLGLIIYLLVVLSEVVVFFVIIEDNLEKFHDLVKFKMLFY